MKSFIACSFLFFCTYFANALLITEFLASNNGGLKDVFGDSSDWIEIYNDGSGTVDLAGYGLSDNAKKPFKWSFPSTNLVAGAFIVVFASDHDLRVTGEELHSGFKLSTDGEYLGLCDPDGNILSEYAPTFPPQFDNVSYGLGCQGELQTIVLRQTNSVAYAFVPSDDSLGTAWQDIAFDDSSWKSGNTGVGYEMAPESATSFTDYIGIDVSEMYEENGSCYIRMPFVVDQPEVLSHLRLRMIYDDGFVAYLNGTEIARKNAPDTLSWNSTATTYHDENDVLTLENFDISSKINLLRSGTNVLSLHALNDTTTSSDFLMDARLEALCVSNVVFSGVGYFSQVTPGAFNGLSFDNRISPVVVSVDSGIFETSFDVTLSSPDDDVIIRYTLDATQPTLEHGELYSGPITISETTTLRAGAFRADALNPRPVARTYVFLDDVIAAPSGVQPGPLWPSGTINGQVFDYGMDENITQAPEYAPYIKNAFTQIPILSLIVSPGNLFNASTGIYTHASRDGRLWERQADIMCLDTSGELFNVGCGLRIRGNFSRTGKNAKHSFRLFFRGEWGASSLKYPLYGSEGTASFDKLDLRTAQNFSWSCSGGNDARENLMCRDVFPRDLQGEMGEPYTRSRYFHLLLNGHYWGIYQSEERPEEHFGETYFGGNKDDYDVIKPDHYVSSACSGNTDAWNALWEMASQGFTEETYLQAVGRNPDGSRNPNYPVLLDPTNLADYTIINNFVGNNDAPLALDGAKPNNFFAVYNRVNPQGFKFFCHDSEHSMVKSYLNTDKTKTKDTGKASPGAFNPRYLHQQLCATEGYKKVFRSRVSKYYFQNGLCTTARATELFMKRVKEIDLAIIAESARWGDVRTDYKDYQPFTKNDHWIPEITWVTGTFIRTRYNLTLSQFRTRTWYPNYAPPVITPNGGVIAEGNTVELSGDFPLLYTLDGSDPTDSDTALPYTAPLTLSKPGLLRVAYSPAECSTPLECQAYFTVEKTSPLLVTEIMYMPKAEGSLFSEKDYEFLELYNNSDEAFFPGSQYITGGVTFAFASLAKEIPARSYVLVVANKAAFAERYDTNGLYIAGEFKGSLSNSGETLVLSNYSLTYGGKWYEEARGLGPSIVPQDYSRELEAYSTKSAWRVSAFPFGSPGFGEVPEPTMVLTILIFLFGLKRKFA